MFQLRLELTTAGYPVERLGTPNMGSNTETFWVWEEGESFEDSRQYTASSVELALEIEARGYVDDYDACGTRIVHILKESELNQIPKPENEASLSQWDDYAEQAASKAHTFQITSHLLQHFQIEISPVEG